MSDLKLYFWGAPRIEQNGKSIHINRHKSIALLVYLAVTQRNHYRDWLITLLWPDVATGRTQLRIALSNLRSSLGNEWFITNRDEIGLTESVWVDINYLRALVERLGKTPGGSLQRSMLLDEAIALCRTHFLAGFNVHDAPDFEQWQRVEEENLDNLYQRLLNERINDLIMQRDFENPQPLVQRLIQMDPLDEPARRQMMRLYAWTNQRQRALREYETFAAVLYEQLKLHPEQETTLIYQAIQQQQNIPFPERPSPGIQVNHHQAYQLPVSLPLIGREQEAETILELLNSGSRLLTLTGPSGIGKTHLAVYVANQIKHRFRDGCYFVTIEANVSAMFLTSALLDALNLHGASVEDKKGLLKTSLMNMEVLFVVDNFHRVADGVSLIHELLQAAPNLTCLLTSYDLLMLSSEYCFPLRGLSVETDVYGSTPAIELFRHQARHVRPGFGVTPENRQAIDQICKLVQGMPLGIILAAAWCDILVPEDIAQNIEANYDFLSLNNHDLPERHRSIRAVFNTNWANQSQPEQQALMRLSVFQGGFNYEAAWIVANVSLGTIKKLAAKSMLYHDVSLNRYTIHDLLRQYALEKAQRDGEIQAIYEAHSLFFINLVVKHGSSMKGHLQHTAWQIFDQDVENIRTAWRYALKEGLFEAIIPMIEPFRLYLQAKGLWDQGIWLFEEARTQTANHKSASAEQVYMRALSRLYIRDDQTPDRLNVALEMAKQQQDYAEMAHILGEQGWYWLEEGCYTRAKDCFDEALKFYIGQDEYYYSALLFRGLAYAAIGMREREQAQYNMRQSLHKRRMIGDWLGEHETLVLRGEISLLKGYVDAARGDFLDAFHYYSTHFSEQAALYRCTGLAWASIFNAEYDDALKIAQQFLELAPAPIMSPVRATAIAVHAFVHTLQADRTSAFHYVEELEILLNTEYQWPSKLNPDLLFFIHLARCVTDLILGRFKQAHQTLKHITQVQMFTSTDHLCWLCPVVAILLVKNHFDSMASELLALFATSEISLLPWIQDWDPLQNLLEDAKKSPAQNSYTPGLSKVLDAIPYLK